MFDVKDFYPSIKETLLTKAINFAEKLVNITNEGKVIIKHARTSLLYDNSEPWMKKDSGLFDITMDAYDLGGNMRDGRNIPFIQTFSET